MNIQKYVLMNQNIKVLDFGFDEELNIITEVFNIYNIDYAPYKLKTEFDVNNTVDRLTINNWFNGRGIPMHRDNVKELMEQFNIDTPKELINKHFALSLSDQYWVKPFDSQIEWKDINYFDNDYDVINFTNATFGEDASSSIGSISTISSNKFQTPNNTTDGQLKKVWIKANKKNFLYKASGTLYNFEPINEVLASRICEILNVPYVPYTLTVVHSKRQDTLVSVCECAISKNQEIITAYNICKRKDNQDIKDFYNSYIEILNDHNVPNAEEYIQKMFMLDYITLNEDRHLNNFGIVRDVNTLNWVSVCPIFDTGRSMNTNVTFSYWDFKNGEVKCFTPNLVPSEIVTYLFTVHISHEQIDKLKKLPLEYESILNEYKSYTNLSDEQIKALGEGLTQRINIFEHILRQKNLIN